VKISIELDSTRAEGQTIEASIIEAAAQELLGDFNSDLRNTIRTLVEREAKALIVQGVDAVVGDAIRGVKLNGYIAGQSVSNATIQEIAIAVCQAQLTWRDGSYDSDRSLLTRVVRREVDSALDRELTEAIKAAKKQTVDAVREKAADVIAKTLAPEIGF